MLAIRRRFELPGLALRRFDAVMALGVRAYVVETRGVVFDTVAQRVVLGGGIVERPGQLAIVLEGEYVFRRLAGAFTTLRRGDAVLAPVDAWDERWDGGRFRLLVLEWDERRGRSVSGATSVRVDPTLLARLEAFADRVQRDGADAAADFPAFLEVARAMGAPVDAAEGSILVPPPAPIARVHAALSRVLTDPAEAPRWVDVQTELGVSERTLRRWLAAEPDWFGWYPDFRRTVLYWKLSSAGILATATGAKLEDVARATGYGSSRAMIGALESHGLGTPSELKRAVGVPSR